MRKLLFISIFFLTCTVVLGQPRYGLPNFVVDSSKMSFGIYAEYNLGSTALTNRLYADYFIRQTYIERTVIDKTRDRLAKFNKVGGDVNYGLFYSHKIDTLFGKTGWNYSINMADRIHLDALFTDDFFTVLFYGNKLFEGDTAAMGGFSANYMHYQQLQLGLIKTNNNNSIFGFGLAFLKGQQFYEMNVLRANLYTSQLGMENDIDILYRSVESDPDKNGMNSMSGMGISADIFYQIPYYVLQKTEEDVGNWKGYLRIEAKDLGFIRWNDQATAKVMDTVVHNEGVWFPTVATPETWADDQKDSLDQLLQPKIYKGAFTSPLPGLLHLKMYQENDNGLYISLGTVLRMFANYSPMMYIGGGKKFSDKLRVGGAMEFGGYGRFNLGLEAGTYIGGYEIIVGSRSISGILFPMIAGGNSAFLSVKKKF